MCHICTSFYCCHKCFQPLNYGIVQFIPSWKDTHLTEYYNNIDSFRSEYCQNSYRTLNKLRAFCNKCSVEIAKKAIEIAEYGDTLHIDIDIEKNIATFSFGIIGFKMAECKPIGHAVFGSYREPNNSKWSMRFIKFVDHTGAVWSGKCQHWKRVYKRKYKMTPQEPIIMKDLENESA